MFKKFHITCNEATTICDKSQYNECSFWEKLRLKWHFVKCNYCKTYVEQNKCMSSMYKLKATEAKKKINCLTTLEKAALKKKLEEYKQ